MSAREGRRGPYAKSAERRTAIAAAALATVIEGGHRSLTTAAVAARAGLSERTMLYHCPTRDHLLVAALECFESSVPQPTGDVRARLVQAGVSMIPRLVLEGGQPREVRELSNALFAESANKDHPAHEYFRRRNTETLAIFADLVRAQQADGTAHPDLDPERVARHLLATWDGLQTLWLSSGDFDLVDDIEDAFQRLTGQNTQRARIALEHLAGTI